VAGSLEAGVDEDDPVGVAITIDVLVERVPFPAGTEEEELAPEPAPEPTPFEGVRPSPEETTSVLEEAIEDSVCEVGEEGVSDEPDPEFDSEVGDEVDPVLDGDDEPGAEVTAEEEDAGAEDEGGTTTEDEDDGEVTALQERSYSGVELRELPTTPKDGPSLATGASWRVYHQVLVFPKREHPTWSQ